MQCIHYGCFDFVLAGKSILCIYCALPNAHHILEIAGFFFFNIFLPYPFLCLTLSGYLFQLLYCAFLQGQFLTGLILLTSCPITWRIHEFKSKISPASSFFFFFLTSQWLILLTLFNTCTMKPSDSL